MTGIFILSLDTEIAWGTYGAAKLRASSPCFDGYRAYFPRLVALLDQYQIPATWAVVGHLFLDRCDGHPDVLQPHYTWADAPDSARDPCSDVDRAPWYYGADIIAQIRAANMPHDIGTHTFTHVIAGDPAVNRAIWESQLAKCAALHAQHGLTMRSLVYPQNNIAYLDTLPDYHIIAYRGEEESWYRGFPRRLQRACHLLDRTLALPPPTYDPARLKVNDRLVNLPASQFLMAYDGIRGKIPTGARVAQARRGLDAAVRKGHIYHLWFHPFNLGTSSAMFDALEQILREVVRRRDASDLSVLTMADAAAWILGANGSTDNKAKLTAEAQSQGER